MLIRLFWSFFQIGLFCIGGGYAAMPLIRDQVLIQNAWMTESEFTDLITISELTPGPIGINSASFVGARVAGIPGALCATLGFILPACIIVMVLAWLYKKYKNMPLLNGALRGLRPAVVGMIAGAATTLMRASFLADTGTAVGGVDLAALILFAAAFFVLRKWRPSPILVMCACGVAGLAVYGFFGV